MSGAPRNPARDRMDTLELRPYPGLEAVVGELVRVVDAERSRPGTRTLAVRLAVEGGMPTNRAGQPDFRNGEALARALYAAVVRRVNYARDPVGVELVQSPRSTIQRGIGDCEDMVVLGASLLSSLGVPVRIVLAGYGAAGFDHTFLEYDAGRGWRAWDATLATDVGDFPPGARRIRRISLGSAARFGLSGGPDRIGIVRTAPTWEPPGPVVATTGTIERGGSPGSARPWFETRGYPASGVAIRAIGGTTSDGGQYSSYRFDGVDYPLPTPRSGEMNEALRRAIESGNPVAFGGITWTWVKSRLYADGQPYGLFMGGSSGSGDGSDGQSGGGSGDAAGDSSGDSAGTSDDPKSLLGLPVPVALGGAAVAAFLLFKK